MNLFLSRNKYSLLLTLIFLVSELIVNPIGEFALNDDWSYAKTVLILIKEGDIYIGHWCAMTLASHVVWGFLFTKIFGFSFTVLRFSNLVSSLIGILLLNKLVLSISKDKVIAFAAALTMMLNPLYFNLSNTFMTDINFNTWMLAGILLVHNFFESRKPVYLILIFLVSCVLVLNRQFGIILPFCFAIACLFTGNKKWIYATLAITVSLATLFIFKWYEGYLNKVLPAFAAYKLYNNVSLTDGDFFARTVLFFLERYKTILMHLLLYSAPISLVLYRHASNTLNVKTKLIIFVLNAGIVISFFYDTHFPTGNVLTNTSLGPDSFYGSKDDWFHPEKRHTFSVNNETIFFIAKLVLMLCSSTVLTFYMYKGFSGLKKKSFPKVNSLFIMIVTLVIAYVMLLFVSRSFFDRYNIPLITLAIVLFSFLPVQNARLSLPYFVLTVVFFYVSVFGTKDYLEINRIRWKAVDMVKREKQTSIETISGGFEVNCWNDGDYRWWADYINLDNYTYLIQYGNEPGFRLYKEFEFQRYFPYRKDTIKVLERVVPVEAK